MAPSRAFSSLLLGIWTLGGANASALAGGHLCSEASSDVSCADEEAELTRVSLLQRRSSSGIAADGSKERPKRGRRVTFHNQCQRPMVMAATGGNSQLACSTTADCPEGLVCDTEHTKSCYFTFEEPSTGWTIAAGDTLVMYTPNVEVTQLNGATVDWSGNIAFVPNSTQDGGAFPSAICNNMDHCPPWQGLTGVHTVVEFTFQPHGPDFYDVSVINGMNVGIEMKPDTNFDPVSDAAAESYAGYNCGAAGASTQRNKKLSPCSWSFEPKVNDTDVSALLTMVEDVSPATPCTSDADCTGGLVCGQVAVVVQNGQTGYWQPTTDIKMQCGNKIAMWTQWQLCVWSGMTYKSPAPFEGLVDCPAYWQAYACEGGAPWSTSCYSQNAKGAECCGCPDWTEVLGTPVPPNAGGCYGSSALWMEKVLPFDTIMKAGCPTAYSYQYDDETSTFTCQTAESRANPAVKNVADYVITLCPDETR
eukprot:TRINITY_DN26578_c0_g1_i1.p1 TRINITY_DN26578_c0_g1~~TRINITY_DN26578_c0_g1_i1.p1  ORF type:complete len:514 (-),score=70.55 TRINITY_DN26578_c0_g1_i1:44-1474(-)